MEAEGATPLLRIDALGQQCVTRRTADALAKPIRQAHNYLGLYIVDGSIVPSNPGVNPQPDDRGTGGVRYEPRAGEGRPASRLGQDGVDQPGGAERA